MIYDLYINTSINEVQMYNTSKMVEIAWKLAHYHAHQWATVTTTPPSSWDEAWSLYDASCKGLQAWQIGLSPSPVHTTGTGRIKWSVGYNGTATITVNRPNGQILSFVVKNSTITDYYKSDTIYARHWDSILECLRALNVSDDSIKHFHQSLDVIDDCISE